MLQFGEKTRIRLRQGGLLLVIMQNIIDILQEAETCQIFAPPGDEFPHDADTISHQHPLQWVQGRVLVEGFYQQVTQIRSDALAFLLHRIVG